MLLFPSELDKEYKKALMVGPKSNGYIHFELGFNFRLYPRLKDLATVGESISDLSGMIN